MKPINAVASGFPMLALAAMAIATGGLAGCTYAGSPETTAAASRGEAAAVPVASALLVAADGSARGQAWVVDRDGRWEIRVDAEGLTPGPHGTHLHTVGECVAPGFTTAGGHLNPHGRMHGSENPQGMHLGDLPNLTAGADGKGSLIVPLADNPAQLRTELFDADGTAVVIHAGPDDYRTDPAGDSGSRIACGVLTPAQ